jgi:dTDP-4-amino-4,6-dideoxygalactose transaminase
MNFGEMRAPEAQRDFHAYGMGWMYRTSDLPAAFARSQLRKLTRTNDEARANWARLDRALEGTPNLVRPFNTREQASNGYAYVVRPERGYAKRRGVKLAALQAGIVEALKAEGVPMGAARWLLPAHTVFQAKNGYGHGCPWTCGFARPDISYDLGQYPAGIDCVDSCIWLAVNGHRPPNGDAQVDAMAAGVRKVFESLDEVPVER